MNVPDEHEDESYIAGYRAAMKELRSYTETRMPDEDNGHICEDCGSQKIQVFGGWTCTECE